MQYSSIFLKLLIRSDTKVWFLKFFESYLYNRKRRVMINGSYSDYANIESGVFMGFLARGTKTLRLSTLNLGHILSHEHAHFTKHTDTQQWTERICETLSLRFSCRGSYICQNISCPNVQDFGFNRTDFIRSNDNVTCSICSKPVSYILWSKAVYRRKSRYECAYC